MALAAEFVEILVCPVSREPLVYFENGHGEFREPFLFCPASKLRYRIESDVPVLLADEAEQVDDATARELSQAS